MTNKEVCEYIAEHFFKLSKNELGWFWSGNEGCMGGAGFAPVHDYISNYQPVLEKLLTNQNHNDFRVHYDEDDIFTVDFRYWTGDKREQILIKGKGLGEAICRAAVEYDKAKRGEE